MISTVLQPPKTQDSYVNVNMEQEIDHQCKKVGVRTMDAIMISAVLHPPKTQDSYVNVEMKQVIDHQYTKVGLGFGQ